MKTPGLSFAVRSLLLAACLGWFGLPSAFAQKLYSVDRSSPRLRELNPANGATVSSVNMTLTGRSISGATGLAADPTTGKFYALVRLVPFVAEHPSVRQLVTVDVTTGVVTDIGPAGGNGNLAFADLAFDANGNLYGVTGDNSPVQPRTLFTLNKSNGTSTTVRALGNGGDGESIAYNSTDGLMYHASGVNLTGTVPPPSGLVFESFSLASSSSPPVRITLSGATPLQEAAALTYAGSGAFLWSSLDFNENLVFRLMKVTSTGTITLVGTTDHLATGLAFVPTVPTGNPLPTITSTNPVSVVAGSGQFPLEVNGTGFGSAPTVRWNGENRPIIFASDTRVTATISATDVAIAGTALVTVRNNATGNISAPRNFTITAGTVPPGPTGPPTVSFSLPRNRGVYLNDIPLQIRLSIGGDQTGVADFLVSFDGSQPVIRPPALETVATSLNTTGWKPVLVQARNTGSAVVASAKVDVLIVDGPIIRNLLLILSRLIRGSPPAVPASPPVAVASPPPPSSPLRQALIRAAADVLDINLDVFRAFRDNVLSATAAGRYYTDVYQRTSFALIEIAALEPTQALAIHQAVLDWTPAIQALANQQGGTVTITPAMAAQVQTLLTNLRRSATGELATIMDAEMAALNPSTWSGLTIGQLLARVESQPRTPPPLVAPGRISNMSIRSSAGTGAQTLIVGAVIGGAGTSGNKPLLIRGVGPALTGFGVPGALADPILTVFAGTNVVDSNDNWSGDPQVTTIGNAVGAFGLTPATSRDAALYAPSLAPRDYTIQITGAGGATGVVLAEIYDATPADSFTATRPQLVNVSARTQVGTGADILIAGFTLAGNNPRRLLIRAVGPTLAAFGVTGALTDPQLALFSGTNRLQENNDWGAAANAADVTAATTQLGTFQLGAGARDSAILTTLQPGSYTAQISGVGNTSGVALVEIYVLP